ncbi:Haloacid Dehalogenase Superfamily Class (subfamily) IIA [Actinopolyspora xinjiangensis]|uniref:Haloacid Dehalogenase Superfamily Class (Subfamily) IIA n=1 Tax=Actinopolyspora xinjiangensis TaxID=405564 RepID=A0A1H0WSK4_9ACTN|nr:HAD-IIA family hydrolase [Actinopolyspora xinjiangensis]SDP93629.1 Haloacid Dehalogenase Superfamily Class (subfamily) IIA [Actinopolyspora xinjiangensis]
MRQSLGAEHDALLFDLDGTVYRGGEVIEGAESTISRVRQAGVSVRYVTNNASKPPEEVAAALNELGVAATVPEVSTSAQAGAALLAERVPPGSPVLVVGTGALAEELANVGLSPVRGADSAPVAVIQGHSPHTTWADLAEACLAIRGGAVWVACNRDATLPTERGELPGNGALVTALGEATGSSPLVAGKPERTLLDRAVNTADALRPMLVGDRLETDILGAYRAGIPSMMVLSGVSTPAELLAAPVECRPTYVAADLTALEAPAETTMIAEQAGWKVDVTGSGLSLAAVSAAGFGAAIGSPGEWTGLTALRALCTARWAVGSGETTVTPEDSTAEAVLRELGLLGFDDERFGTSAVG